VRNKTAWGTMGEDPVRS